MPNKVIDWILSQINKINSLHAPFDKENLVTNVYYYGESMEIQLTMSFRKFIKSVSNMLQIQIGRAHV